MHLTLFREYLAMEFGAARATLPFPFDVERVVDDFILLAFFVGNDFLPSLPSMYIPNGSLAVLFQCYKQALPQLGASVARRPPCPYPPLTSPR
jgi:5'-3' exoribonuclease 1